MISFIVEKKLRLFCENRMTSVGTYSKIVAYFVPDTWRRGLFKGEAWSRVRLIRE